MTVVVPDEVSMTMAFAVAARPVPDDHEAWMGWLAAS